MIFEHSVYKETFPITFKPLNANLSKMFLRIFWGERDWVGGADRPARIPGPLGQHGGTDYSLVQIDYQGKNKPRSSLTDSKWIGFKIRKQVLQVSLSKFPEL